MLDREKRLPLRPGILQRPRVDTLLDAALTRGLVTVVAPHGYGKTLALATHLLDKPVRLIWMRVSQMDNLPARFYRTMLRALEPEFPQQAERLAALPFPDDLQTLDHCLRIFAEGVYAGPHIVHVFDQFEAITNPSVLRFVNALVDADMENSTIVLVSSRFTDVDGLTSNGAMGVARVMLDDLRFTMDEARDLFTMVGVSLSDGDARLLDEALEGWPFPLYLAATYLRRNPHINPTLALPHIMSSGSFRMLNRHYYQDEAPAMQRLLVRLAMLPGFTLELATALAGDDGALALAATTLLEENLFIAYDPLTRLLVFHQMYRSFLQVKGIVLDAGERALVHATAADLYAAEGHTLEAIESYELSRQYAPMLAQISIFASARMGMVHGQAEYLLDKLDALPERLQDENPLVDYLRGFLYLGQLRTVESERTLLALCHRIEAEMRPADLPMLGEAYIMLGGLHMMKLDPGFGQYYKKACDYLPEGTQFKTDRLMVENNRVFSLPDNTPGALARVERAVHEGVAWMVKASRAGHGLEHLYSAEAGNLIMDFDKARRHGFEALEVGMEHAQHDIVCNAHFALAEAAHLQGDYDEMASRIQAVCDYAAAHDAFPALLDMAEWGTSWMATVVKDQSQLSPWITSPQAPRESSRPLITLGRDRLLYVTCLMEMGRFEEVLPMTAQMLHWFDQRGLWTDRLFTLLVRALTQHRLGEMAAMLDTLALAYDMAHGNGIIGPFVCFGSVIRPLLDEVARTKDARFDPAWQRMIAAKANTYAKRRAALVQAHTRRQHAHGPDVRLSRREMDMLRALSQGMTRDAIASSHQVSVNTVKTTITHLYNKLGAINQADAIRIALFKGLLEAE